MGSRQNPQPSETPSRLPLPTTPSPTYSRSNFVSSYGPGTEIYSGTPPNPSPRPIHSSPPGLSSVPGTKPSLTPPPPRASPPPPPLCCPASRGGCPLPHP